MIAMNIVVIFKGVGRLPNTERSKHTMDADNGGCVQTLVGELRSHKPHSQKKKKKRYCIK